MCNVLLLSLSLLMTMLTLGGTWQCPCHEGYGESKTGSSWLSRLLKDNTQLFTLNDTVATVSLDITKLLLHLVY